MNTPLVLFYVCVYLMYIIFRSKRQYDDNQDHENKRARTEAATRVRTFKIIN